MRRPAVSSPRWLRVLVALLALLCGSGAHEVLHELGVTRSGEQPTAPFEAHDAGCAHRGDAPVHEHPVCVLCKTAGSHHAVLPAFAPLAAPLLASGETPVAASERFFPAPIPGSLGARAPPVTVG